MRGSIVARGDAYRLKVPQGKDPKTGKYTAYYETFHGSHPQAEKRLRQLLTDVDNNTFIKPGKETVAAYLDRWLKDYAYANLAPHTSDGYHSIISRHLIPALGAIQLTQLRPDTIQTYIADKLCHGNTRDKGALSARTVRHHIVCLHTALQHAIKMGLLLRNPVDAITVPRAERHDMRTMSETDVHIFLELAKDTQYHAIFYTAIFTGMRRSELLALRWQDADLTMLQLSVARCLHQIKGGRTLFRHPKTEKSRRSIALTPSTAALLRQHRDSQNILRQSLDLPSLTDSDLIFCHIDGKPFLPNTVTHNWIKLVRRSGLDRIRFHDARHTHASLMLKAGIHPKIVQERLGHSSIQITLDTYSHVAPGLQQKAAEAFDTMIMPKNVVSASV